MLGLCNLSWMDASISASSSRTRCASVSGVLRTILPCTVMNSWIGRSNLPLAGANCGISFKVRLRFSTLRCSVGVNCALGNCTSSSFLETVSIFFTSRCSIALLTSRTILLYSFCGLDNLSPGLDLSGNNFTGAPLDLTNSCSCLPIARRVGISSLTRPRTSFATCSPASFARSNGVLRI